MGINRFFWPQELLDQWIGDEKVSLEDDLLTISGENRQYRLDQAVHFIADGGDGTDPHKLVGRVKELTVLEEIGAEHYMDSVLVEDSAYQVVPGFLGAVIASQRKTPEGPQDISGAIATETGENGENGEGDDRELLAKFLLENL